MAAYGFGSSIKFGGYDHGPFSVNFGPSFLYREDTYGPIEVKQHTPLQIFTNPPPHSDEYFVCRLKNGRDTQYLHKDGSWNPMCEAPGFFKTKREAEVAAVLAGMPSPEVEKLKEEVKGLKDANERAVKRLADKQAILEQVSREAAESKLQAANLKKEGECYAESLADERNRNAPGSLAWRIENQASHIASLQAEVAKLKEVRDDYKSANEIRERTGNLQSQQIDSLRSEVAKLNGDLAQATSKTHPTDFGSRLTACEMIAKLGISNYESGMSCAVDAVRKLRADYDALSASNRALRSNSVSAATYNELFKQYSEATAKLYRAKTALEAL